MGHLRTASSQTTSTQKTVPRRHTVGLFSGWNEVHHQMPYRCPLRAAFSRDSKQCMLKLGSCYCVEIRYCAWATTS
eukprot:566809-Pleurochrysis_carterae.AAC.3